MYLVEVGISLQYRSPFEHLSKNATYTPHVYSRSIFPQYKKQFWRSVPASDHKRSIVSRSFAAAISSLRRRIVVRSSQTEVGNLKYAVIIDEKIGSLHIAVKYFARVQVSDSLEQLYHVAFDLRLRELNGRILKEAG